MVNVLDKVFETIKERFEGKSVVVWLRRGDYDCDQVTILNALRNNLAKQDVHLVEFDCLNTGFVKSLILAKIFKSAK